MRAPVVFYNRCNEAAQQLKPGDFDWEAILGGGCRWFHRSVPHLVVCPMFPPSGLVALNACQFPSGGIFAALSPTTSQVTREPSQPPL